MVIRNNGEYFGIMWATGGGIGQHILYCMGHAGAGIGYRRGGMGHHGGGWI